jgi:two-component system, OmpR family, phosphate regulon sensor histidine kinase PhoR
MKLTLKEWLIVSALLMGALILGFWTGAWSLMLLLGLLCWLALQQRELNALRRWADRPLTRPDNRLESWQRLSNRLYRSVRRSRRRSARVIGRFQSLRIITDALPDAAVIVDREGRIESFNTAAGEFLHLRPSDRGANLTALVRQPDLVALIKGTKNDEIVEFASPFADERRLEARRIVIDGSKALVLIRDVTQLNRLLTMRQDFVANVSHELRTPLTVVVGYLEAMSDEDLDLATMRTLLTKLDAPTARMRALVDDLLLLSRLEASPAPAPADLVVIDIANAAQACVSEARALNEGRHRFEINCDPTVRLLGVESEIYSALLNMVTNAVRYSPDGGPITVTWRATRDGARLSVADRGLGIAPEHLHRITERFFRVDLAKSRVRGGTGLGLAIVKHVLKRHNTMLRVESELGAGSTFHCDFTHQQLEYADGGTQEAS